MRRVARRRTIMAIGLALWSGTVLADPDPAPFVAMRTLQNLQEQIAHGDATAQSAQPKLMAHIADGFLAADPAVWREPRNARAAILFLLSGGRPGVVRTILEHTTFPVDLDRLLKGALAYAEGQDDVARALLDPIDPQSVPSALGAHLALVKANLFADHDPAKAIKLFDTARLLAPGTLIEEAAVRREIFVLIDVGPSPKAMQLARQYLRRFRTSSYADDFKQRFAAASIRLAQSGDVAQMGQLDAVLNDMPASESRALYLAFARLAAIGGRPAEARLAADKVLATAAKGSVDELRAKLYRGTSLVVSDTPEVGMRSLAALDLARLSASDAALRDAALAIAAAIQADEALSTGADPGSPATDPAQVTIEHARSAIADGQKLLAASGP